MKTSLKKLRGALHKHDARERRDLRPLAQLDELAQASQNMEEMRDCYDSLLSAAAATANCAYEFSESLREMGSCLLEKTALNEDEESGKVLLMMGKVQFELHKIMDNYRSHISQTITIPSESLLNELRTVEEMKRQCDEKRQVCEYMAMRQREKGRSKGSKVENFSMQQIQEAWDDYDEEATLFVFRLKSLKQGQSRSLLTQAARHHAAQLCFVKKALKSLEAIEPSIELVAVEQHIDYHFSGLEDDGDVGHHDYEEGSDARDDGELSFDYSQNDVELDTASTTLNSMELNQSDLTFPIVTKEDVVKEIRHRNYRKSFSFKGETRISSQSAPLSAENPSEKVLQSRPSLTRKLNTYALPMPGDTKSPKSPVLSIPVPHTARASTSSVANTHNLWQSTPLEPQAKIIVGDNKISRSGVINPQSVLRENNSNIISTPSPPPLADGILSSRLGVLNAYEPKKMKIQSFSGPLISKQWLTKPGSVEPTHLFSQPILQTKMPSPPKRSPTASPTFVSSPKISELHELPRPPVRSTHKASRVLGYSAPLVSKGPVLTATNRIPFATSASPLPKPPQPVISRSYSIPSHRARTLPVSNLVESVLKSEMDEDFASPPLTPMTLSNNQQSSVSLETDMIDHMKGAD